MELIRRTVVRDWIPLGGQCETELAVFFPERFPISRWYILPLAQRMVSCLATTPVRPNHLTALNLFFSLLAATVVCLSPIWAPCAAILLWLAWLGDRCDGPLARLQQTATPTGAWFDANVDELTDLVLHGAMAWAAYSQSPSWWPAALLMAFLSGKYLCMFGLLTGSNLAAAERGQPPVTSPIWSCRSLYHLAGDADLRMHVALAVLLSGWYLAGLAYVALYYNLRWIVRYGLVLRRGGEA